VLRKGSAVTDYTAKAVARRDALIEKARADLDTAYAEWHRVYAEYTAAVEAYYALPLNPDAPMTGEERSAYTRLKAASEADADAEQAYTAALRRLWEVEQIDVAREADRLRAKDEKTG